jgi:rhamnose utilization protein RhaD (predicted bifunctional aldolase and dehydrogenase)
MEDFIKASNEIGQNSIYIQGSGGNSSIKIGERLYIKASGYKMREMTIHSGIACCSYQDIKSFLDKKKRFNSSEEEVFLKQVNSSIIQKETFGLPSMETGMHAIIPSKYVFHLHSVYANIFNCMKYGSRYIKKIVKESFLYMPYLNPGYALAFKLKQVKKLDRLIFLKNHGIIVHGDNLEDCLFAIQKLHKDIEDFLKNSQIFTPFIVKKVNDIKDNHLFPDSVVFSNVEINELNSSQREVYYEISSAGIYIEQMIKKMGNSICYLQKKDIEYIANMQQEKHRLSIFANQK